MLLRHLQQCYKFLRSHNQHAFAFGDRQALVDQVQVLRRPEPIADRVPPTERNMVFQQMLFLTVG